ncbi:hypothetical protein [Coprobacter tertius]|uniref:Uncharacterized protein n=1 Tax=Coprobacter tertius TaxID=2944915 RepID=A0ABT1MH41_9BACT|nr:hypothetical protein [Coprobacter tertius]MCP9611947.1 hypothetical protein [Coprobacter tertius]
MKATFFKTKILIKATLVIHEKLSEVQQEINTSILRQISKVSNDKD